MLFGLYCAVVAIGNWKAILAITRFALANETASHVLVVPVVSATLLIQARDSVVRPARPNPLLGLLLVGAGLTMAMGIALVCPFSSCANTLSVTGVGLVLMWVGGFVGFLGRSAAMVAIFPLGFLVLAIPPPAAAVDAATQFLKHGSATVVEALFALSGTTFHRDGFVFSFPGLSIEIANECSGIRSSIALVLTGLLAGHVFLRRWWSQCLLIVLILPLSLLKNAIRIVVLTLLSIHVNPAFLEGQLHHEGGIVFFLIALLLLAPALPLLRRLEGTAATPSMSYRRFHR